jgi:hypothetical protein
MRWTGTVALAALAAWTVLAAGPGTPEARAGQPDAAGMLITWTEVAFDPHSKSYKQYEGYANWRLPWDWTGPKGWAGHTALQVTAGDMWINTKRGSLISAGPLASLEAAGGLLSIHAGIRPTYISRHAFRGLDLGTKIQFTSHIGFLVRPVPHIAVGWRLQHMSNGGLDKTNPGVNLSTVEVRAEW